MGKQIARKISSLFVFSNVEVVLEIKGIILEDKWSIMLITSDVIDDVLIYISQISAKD